FLLPLPRLTINTGPVIASSQSLFFLLPFPLPSLSSERKLPSPMEPSGRNWVRGRPIGSGSFATVSLALDRSQGEVFAVKSVALNGANLAAILSLSNEIRILSSVRSPYVVQYLGDDVSREARSGACRNLHMEYLPGGSVADLAAERRRKGCPVDDADVRSYTRCVTRALRYLHDVAGVVHCDVKGRNVLLGGAAGVAKLADFGAAVRISGGDARSWVRGTPLWMAPEVARGERPRPESDVWSLGCTVIEMATGAQPWPDWRLKDAAEAMFRIGYGDELPEFPPLLLEVARDFLDKCLRRDASERWTAEQLLQHPFLAEAETPMEETPRGVLEWANLEFHDGADDGEGCSASYSDLSDSPELVASGRKRVGELASCGGVLAWESDDWEEVRRVEELNLQGDKAEEERGTFWECPDCTSLGSADKHGGVSEEQGDDLPSVMRCSVSSPTASCPCSFCKGRLVCHHVNGLIRVLFFGCCCLLSQQWIKFHGLPCYINSNKNLTWDLLHSTVICITCVSHSSRHKSTTESMVTSHQMLCCTFFSCAYILIQHDVSLCLWQWLA
ncbi:unnamed protein product, partial [Musa acuminata var. zebrina]